MRWPSDCRFDPRQSTVVPADFTHRKQKVAFANEGAEKAKVEEEVANRKRKVEEHAKWEGEPLCPSPYPSSEDQFSVGLWPAWRVLRAFHAGSQRRPSSASTPYPTSRLLGRSLTHGLLFRSSFLWDSCRIIRYFLQSVETIVSIIGEISTRRSQRNPRGTSMSWARCARAQTSREYHDFAFYPLSPVIGAFLTIFSGLSSVPYCRMRRNASSVIKETIRPMQCGGTNPTRRTAAGKSSRDFRPAPSTWLGGLSPSAHLTRPRGTGRSTPQPRLRALLLTLTIPFQRSLIRLSRPLPGGPERGRGSIRKSLRVSSSSHLWSTTRERPDAARHVRRAADGVAAWEGGSVGWRDGFERREVVNAR